ncbi:MAG: prolyl oligopeptidase family serine peptidase [Pyrinomonadaceae bacterium]
MGPFVAGGSKDDAPGVKAEAALDRDFMSSLGRGEAQVRASDFPQIDKGIFSRFFLPTDFKNAHAHFDDGVIRFDKLFQTTRNAVAYAACVIESAEDQEVVLVSGADDALKAWLNGELLLRTSVRKTASGQPAYGNLGKSGSFTPVGLKKGQNFLLVKVTQIDRMWGFNCGLFTLEAARSRSQANELYMRDVVEQSILPPAASLRLNAELSGLLRTLKLPARVEILDASRTVVSSDEVDYRVAWSRSLEGIGEGLYFCRVSCSLYVLEEQFYHGDAESRLASLQERYATLHDLDERARIDFEALQIRRAHLSEPANRQPQEKAWQAKIVYLVKEVEDLLTHLAGRGALNYPGTHLRGFRSKIDEQVQYYMVHVPPKYAADNKPVPLVVLIPFPLPNVPFLKSIHVANIDLINTYVKLADRYGYALLWPFARGNPDGAPVAMTDIFEALEAARADYQFDSERIHLFGWSYGGTYALLMGERWPGLFASIGAIMPPSDLVAFEAGAEHIHSRFAKSWLALNSPVELVESLSNTPVYVIHGDEDKTVSPQQSVNLVDKCRRLGFEVKFDLLPGMDHVYAPVDPTPMMFEFFKDKTLKRNPDTVSLATAQLKYGSAYWLRIDRLTEPTVVGRILATRRSETELEVVTENVSEYEILLGPLGHRNGKPLSVTTNGRLSFSGVPDGDVVRLDLESVAQAQPETLRKNREVEGPILHAFAGPFLLVEGATGPAEGRVNVEVLSRRIRETWMKNYFVECPLKKDWEVTEEDVEKKNLILLGDAETNSLIKKVLPDIPLRIDAESVSVGGQRYEGKNLGVELIYPNPLDKDRYVIILGANNAVGYQRLESNPSQNAWYDFAVWNMDAPQTPEMVAAGSWDSAWQKVRMAPGPR